MRSLVVYLFVASIFILIPFSTFADFTEGLVLYLPFDEGAGDAAKDLSGNGHDGVIDGPDWVDGKFGKALKFNGDGSGTFVTVESTDKLNVNEMTFMAWINAEHWDGTRQIVGKSVHGGCAGRTQYGLFSEGGTFRLRFETEGGRADIDAPEIPAIGEWVHVAFTNDGTTAKIFINGEEVVAGDMLGTLNANDDPWRIGQDCERENYIFAGLIDDVRLWNRALSANEIGEFMGEGASIIAAVELQSKLPTAWGEIKAQY
ncbi:LamG domain-containing protein [bacterium]|nr:LamG domain-containing protein [bacterium]